MKSWIDTYKAGTEVYNWKTDGCSSAPDKFFDVNLVVCCEEHDFYYRNDVGVSRWEADNNLRKCIVAQVTKALGFKGYLLATVYWVGVRVGGGSAYHDFYDNGSDDWPDSDALLV